MISSSVANAIQGTRRPSSQLPSTSERIWWLCSVWAFGLLVLASSCMAPIIPHSSLHRGDGMEERRWLRSRLATERHLIDPSKNKSTLVITASALSTPSTSAPVPTTMIPSLPPTPVLAPTSSTSPPATITQKPVNSSSSSSSSSSSGSTTFKFTASQTVPAVMVGIASSIIVCALFLYASDVKDRCRHDDWVRAHQRRQLQQQPTLQVVVERDAVAAACAFRNHPSTSSSSSLLFKRDSYTHSTITGDDRPSDNSSSSSSHHDAMLLAHDASFMLPPIMGPDDDLLDPVEIMCLEFPTHLRSFSQVSTITGSYLGGDRSPDLELLEEEVVNCDNDMEQSSSLGITELNDMYRLDQNADLTSLVSLSQLPMPSPKATRGATLSSQGLVAAKDMTMTDRDECSSSGKTTTSNQDMDNHQEHDEAAEGEDDVFINEETTSSMTIIGLVPEGSYDDHDDLVDIGNAIVDEDIYILHIHGDDGDNSAGGDEGQEYECYRNNVGDDEPREDIDDGNATVASGASSSSESASLISETELTSPRRLGEMQYASDATPTKDTEQCSFERLADTSHLQVPSVAHEESRDADDNRLSRVRETLDGFEVEQDQRMEAPLCKEALRLEELISSIPFDHLEDPVGAFVNENDHMGLKPASHMNEFVRDVYFVPVPLPDNAYDELISSTSASRSTLGLELNDATSVVTHPTVAHITPSSPLAGRIFEGDFVLRVNDAETAGLSGDNIHRLIKCIQMTPISSNSSGGHVTKMIKLTVMSSQSDGTSDESIDVGILETAFEV